MPYACPSNCFASDSHVSTILVIAVDSASESNPTQPSTPMDGVHSCIHIVTRRIRIATQPCTSLTLLFDSRSSRCAERAGVPAAAGLVRDQGWAHAGGGDERAAIEAPRHRAAATVRVRARAHGDRASRSSPPDGGSPGGGSIFRFAALSWQLELDLARSGKRHVQVHDQNRHEVWEERNALQQQVEELQSEIKRVSSQIAARNIQLAQDLESILHGLDERETVAAEALQDAVLQLFEDTLRMPSVATTARMMEILEIQERLRSLWRERPAPPYRRCSP